MATLAVQKLALGGTEPAYDPAGVGGDGAPVGDRRVLHVRNGSAGSVTVTVTTPGTVGGIAIADPAPAVAAGGDLMIPLGHVYRGANGRAAWTYSAATSVTVAVLELP